MEGKPHPDPKDFHEGPAAAKRFVDAMRKVLSVPRDEIKRREEEWKKARKGQRR